jgi:selenocysteine lyase/cysteine desulfurase
MTAKVGRDLHVARKKSMLSSSKGLRNDQVVQSAPDHRRAFEELERGVRAALETYSNVHRGTGHFSMVSTELFERAREIVLEYLGLKKKRHLVVFCTPRGSEILKTQLRFKNYREVSSRDIGLPLGLRALAVKKSALPKGLPFQTGGSVVKMVSPHSAIWADAPMRYEAGTPSVMNAIALALALRVEREFGADCFKPQADASSPASEILSQDELSGYSGSQLIEELGKMLVGRDLHVPSAKGEIPFINFDNAASTPTFSPVWNVVKRIWRLPVKAHGDIIREVRRILASFLGASQEKYDVIFTSNATEALNTAAWLVRDEIKDDSEWVILNT